MDEENGGAANRRGRFRGVRFRAELEMVITIALSVGLRSRVRLGSLSLPGRKRAPDHRSGPLRQLRSIELPMRRLSHQGNHMKTIC